VVAESISLGFLEAYAEGEIAVEVLPHKQSVSLDRRDIPARMWRFLASLDNGALR
jgi:hypothetical protein